MNPDELRGRDLDAEVERLVFGRDQQPPYYSTNPSASLNLSLALAQRGWVWLGDPRDRPSGRGVVRVVLQRTHSGMQQSVTADGATMEEALARAALKTF